MGIWKKIMPYALHMRPLSWIIVAGHFTMGFIFAGGFKLAYLPALLSGWVVWVVLLNGGALAFNSFYDKDKGDITWLNNPPAIPKYLLQFSILLFIVGLIAAFFVNIKFFIASLSASILSILYSHPKIRLKKITGLDALANVIAYGILTPYAGYALINNEISDSFGLVLVAMFFLTMGGYPLSTIYQYEEDIKRGDRTLTAFLGKKNSLLFSMAAITIGFLIIFYGGYKGLLGHYAILTLFVLVSILVILLNWFFNLDRIDAKKELYKAYLLMIMTDIILAISILLPNKLLF